MEGENVNDIGDILKLLPHRYPFLLVDRIVELELRKRVKGYKNVSANEPFFQGHYPGMPIMPGVLTIEAMAQVGAFMLLADPELSGSTPIIAGIDKAKFRRPVVPGDRLETEAELLWFRNGVGMFKGIARVDGEVVCEAEIAFKLIKAGTVI